MGGFGFKGRNLYPLNTPPDREPDKVIIEETTPN